MKATDLITQVCKGLGVEHKIQRGLPVPPCDLAALPPNVVGAELTNFLSVEEGRGNSKGGAN